MNPDEPLALRIATDNDRTVLAGLLQACGLSSHDLDSSMGTYWLVQSDPPGGACGLEQCGRFGLLRSLAVRDDQRGQGLGRYLVDHVVEDARARGLQALYTFSKDTGALFEHLGWSDAPVAEAALRLRGAPQVARYVRSGWYPDERAFRLTLTV